MRIESIDVQNFCGLRDFQLGFGDRTLIAGRNGAGKSTIRDAIRFAMLGQPGRGITKKKDFAALLSEGAKKGEVKLVVNGYTYKRAVKTGNAGSSIPEPPEALPYVIDADQFARLDEGKRRTFLLGLMGVQMDSKDICRRLEGKGLSKGMIELVRPLLRGGLESAAKHFKEQATNGKRDWERITGEKWGAAKADNWSPEGVAVDVDEQALADAKEEMNDANTELQELNKRLWRAEQNARLIQELEKEAAECRNAMQVNRGKELSENDQAELQAEMRQLNEQIAGDSPRYSCPCCQATLEIANGKLVESGEPVDIEQLQARREALHAQLGSAVVYRNAAVRLEEIGRQIDGVSAGNADKLRQQRDEAMENVECLRAKHAELQSSYDAASTWTERKEDAATTHQRITDSLRIAELLGVDGLQAEILAEALNPINERMAEACKETGWPTVTIGADMEVKAAGRHYGLLSESEQWRCDAVICEAIARLSGIHLMILDRVDVLDLPARSEFVGWVSSMDEMQVIATGTFKQPPVVPAIDTHWIEKGRIAAVEKAA